MSKAKDKKEIKEKKETKENSTCHILVETTFGKFELELDREKAPISTENFIKYVENGHYKGSIFHRVIPGFVIQGGGFLPDMKEKTVKFSAIKNESNNGLTNKRGSIAMARTNDPHSATSQFFINLADNDFLNHVEERWGYAVFGSVTDGMDVIDKISQVETNTQGFHQDVPTETVEIKNIEIK